MTYPEITKGLGKLTPELWSRLMVMLRDYEEAGGGIRRNLDSEKRYREYFMAELTGCTKMLGGTDNRWMYSFKEVVPAATGIGFIDVTGGQTATEEATNLCEGNNTSDEVGTGVYLAGAGYPTGFNMMPVGMTAENFDSGVDTYASLDVSVVVMMYNIRAAGGGLRRVFFAANSHDGECE